MLLPLRKPYTSPLHAAPARTQPDRPDADADESASLLVPQRSGAQAHSPQPHAFASRLFQPRHSARGNESSANTSVNNSFAPPASPAGTGRESVFGPSGLRARTPGVSVTPARPPRMSLPTGAALSPPLDDDLAPPPAQSLDDEDQMDTSSGLTPPAAAPLWPPSSHPSFSAQSADIQPVSQTQAPLSLGLPQSQSQAHAHTQAGDAKVRTLHLFGFPRSLEPLVRDHFGTGLALAQWVPLGASPDGPGYLRAVYSDVGVAVRVLCRSGELVAGTAMVGARIEDEELHRTLLLEGLGRASSSSGRMREASSHPNTSAAAPSTPQPRARNPRASVGRPLSVIGTRDAALAPLAADTSSSFLRLPGWSSPAPPSQDLSQTKRNSSFLGKVSETVFGW